MFNKVMIAGFALAVIAAALIMPSHAVEVFKVSNYDGGHQIWFEAEDFDERIPEGDEYFQVTGEGNAPKAPKGAFGEAIVRVDAAGGTILWKFDINRAGGKGGAWYFWGRIWSPSNKSDYLLVLGDPGDKIPDGPPFPGGRDIPSFEDPDDRIFEVDFPDWGWCGESFDGKKDGHLKKLQDGSNTMYIFHREGNPDVFWDVFMWVALLSQESVYRIDNKN